MNKKDICLEIVIKQIGIEMKHFENWKKENIILPNTKKRCT